MASATFTAAIFYAAGPRGGESYGWAARVESYGWADSATAGFSKVESYGLTV